MVNGGMRCEVEPVSPFWKWTYYTMGSQQKHLWVMEIAQDGWPWLSVALEITHYYSSIWFSLARPRSHYYSGRYHLEQVPQMAQKQKKSGLGLKGLFRRDGLLLVGSLLLSGTCQSRPQHAWTGLELNLPQDCVVHSWACPCLPLPLTIFPTLLRQGEHTPLKATP